MLPTLYEATAYSGLITERKAALEEVAEATMEAVQEELPKMVVQAKVEEEVLLSSLDIKTVMQ